MKNKIIIVGILSLLTGSAFSEASQAPSNSSTPAPNSPATPTTVPTPINPATDNTTLPSANDVINKGTEIKNNNPNINTDGTVSVPKLNTGGTGEPAGN